ncbi:hypothetical protein Syun_019157 [Stephania yunnanensis]|uniref:Uncharacterized protein n=1 Tax=Stephania yunnanensis TaxID=152371 RepID=A0AAP0NXP8_9MAGN
MGESSPTDMNGEYSSPSNPQPLGLEVVGFWIIPTLIGAISYITQVVIGNQHAKPKQKLLLSICSGVALATCVVGGVLFIFCIIQWKKNSGRRGLINNCMIILGFASAFMNIVLKAYYECLSRNVVHGSDSPENGKSELGCVNGYLQCFEYDGENPQNLGRQTIDNPNLKGFMLAVESTNQEETLVGFAIWEPPHGRYKMFKYPWKCYVKLSGGLRHCAFLSWHCMDASSRKYG